MECKKKKDKHRSWKNVNEHKKKSKKEFQWSIKVITDVNARVEMAVLKTRLLTAKMHKNNDINKVL